MGGGSYDTETATAVRSTNRDVFTYQGYTGAPTPVTQRSVHPDLNPHGKERECMNLTPIVVAMDVTRSRGDDSRVIYAKLPMFIGQIELKNYVPGPAISFAAIGDATSGDLAPPRSDRRTSRGSPDGPADGFAMRARPIRSRETARAPRW